MKNLSILILTAGLLNFATASPQVLSQIFESAVNSVYQIKSPLKFSSDTNEKFIVKMMNSLPMAKTASIVSSSPSVDTQWVVSKSLGYSSRDHKQAFIVAVTFQRSDYLPRLHFQITSDWYECKTQNQYCGDSVTYGILGPTQTVTLLSDSGAGLSSYPKALNAFYMTLQLQNIASGSKARNLNTDTVSTATWNFTFQQGYEDYIRYFRTKLDKQMQSRVDVTSIQSAVGLWASEVSRSMFN